MVSCLSRLACVTQRQKDVLSWHSKTTDTSLLYLFRACATVYKLNIVEGTVSRINNATSAWQASDACLSQAKVMLESNRYPPSFLSLSC